MKPPAPTDPAFAPTPAPQPSVGDFLTCRTADDAELSGVVIGVGPAHVLVRLADGRCIGVPLPKPGVDWYMRERQRGRPN